MIEKDAVKYINTIVKQRCAEIYPDKYIDSLELKEAVEMALSCLKERQAKVLRIRYGLDDGHVKTLEETAKILANYDPWYTLTKERIRQIEAKAFRVLRGPKLRRMLIDHIDEVFGRMQL